MDIFDIAMANALNKGGASGGGVKVIDLTKYTQVIQGSTVSHNETLLYLFTIGGGRITISDTTTFWQDVSTGRDVRFVIDASTLSEGITIESEGKSITNAEGVLYAIETSFLVYVSDYCRVTVWFGNLGGTTEFIVVVEPLTVPTA